MRSPSAFRSATLVCALLCALGTSGCVVFELMRGRDYEDKSARYT